MGCVSPVETRPVRLEFGQELRRKEACVELDDESVRLRVVSPVDVDYLRGVEASLSEWASDADEAAFAGL